VYANHANKAVQRIEGPLNYPDKLLREHEQDGYSFRLLTEAEEVYAEGAEMDHCVGGYTQSCANGSYAVYRITGKERATVGVLLTGDKVEFLNGFFDQIRGPRNQAVSSTLDSIAQSLMYVSNDRQEEACAA
jgi:hypothetical protein